MSEHKQLDVVDEAEIIADEERYLISDLCLELEPYMDETQIKDVYQAYLFGAHAHEGQYRMSGEPYIYHPIAVARILAEMHVDSRTIVAAILHDVIEDTPSSKDQIAKEFGEDVAELVDGVSKLTKIENKDKQEEQAENIQKVLLAMARDIRVIMIKLADRLHNMRTLGVMRPDKKRRIAKETLEIYAPIAQRLGINSLRVELENLGFQSMYPYRYAVLKAAVKNVSGHRKEVIQKLDSAIKNRLQELDIDGEAFARKKHLYSLYRKMKTKRLPFKKVFDVYAIRVVVQTVDNCYRVLGVVHNLFKPIPGRFKDYIAIPKGNGYQSLHSAMYGPHAIPMEVQIRTKEMDEFAEAGIAAHWLYKNGDDSHGHQGAQARARDWLTGLLEMQQQAGNPVEFLDNVKVDLFPDEIFVYTPEGDVIKLPKGSTPVDFAYAVHTGVGNTCVAAKLDHQFAPLNTPLYSGQTVDIVTSPMARPNPVWLNYVVSARARSNIRSYLKSLKSGEALAQGTRLMNRCLKVYSTSIDKLEKENIDAVLKDLNFSQVDELLIDIGLGNRPPSLVARRLLPNMNNQDGEAFEALSVQSLAPLAISGTEGMVVSYAKCCYPIPNDHIVGVFNKGRGIVIHREGCNNIESLRHSHDQLVDVTWMDELVGDFTTRICAEVRSQPGVLARLATGISEENANIEGVDIEDRDGLISHITFVLSVKDRQHLANVMRRLRVMSPVLKIWRMR
ncbi:MAG: RelA/SpoT family protein [Gammaproteobacteria bacterium]|nr:RelA/SpoT family protein [Gammaproteobacteria bacterium]